MEVRETKTTTPHDYLNVIKVRGGGLGIGGTLFGLRGEARIVMVDDYDVELPFGTSPCWRESRPTAMAANVVARS
jgi:hypothetical protein